MRDLRCRCARGGMTSWLWDVGCECGIPWCCWYIMAPSVRHLWGDQRVLREAAGRCGERARAGPLRQPRACRAE